MAIPEGLQKKHQQAKGEDKNPGHSSSGEECWRAWAASSTGVVLNSRSCGSCDQECSSWKKGGSGAVLLQKKKVKRLKDEMLRWKRLTEKPRERIVGTPHFFLETVIERLQGIQTAMTR